MHRIIFYTCHIESPNEITSLSFQFQTFKTNKRFATLENEHKTQQTKDHFTASSFE